MKRDLDEEGANSREWEKMAEVCEKWRQVVESRQ